MTQDERSRAPVHALLADGTTTCIRAVRPDDHAQLRALYEEMSPQNLRLRFFAASGRSAVQAADRACAAARPGYCALLAEIRGQIIGLAEYERTEEPATAEISLAVAEGLHHRGIGTLLLEHLVSAARAEGISAFAADALAENHEILKVFADLGLHTARRFEGPELRCRIRLDEDETYLTAVEARGSAADVASLQPLLRPDSVAVVGAGRRAGSVGRAVLRNLRTGGFTRQLFAVNPSVSSLMSVPAYPSVAALPQAPDLAVLAVPAPALAATAEECGKAGVRALVVVTAGLDGAQ
ncbi:GNAT family N-acetyltransferase, partial [Streptomyces sp. NPDC059900]